MSGAPRRIGYDVAGRGWMYTTRVARPRAWRPRHAVQNQWDLLAAIGLAPPTPSTDPVDMPIDFDASQSVARRVEADGARATDEVVVVHVSAGNPFRRWPQSSFATLVASLAVDHPHLRVLVTSGPSERDAAAQVVDQARTTLNASDGARIASLDCSLTELRALVDRAALFVGGDSGPLHIAATSHVPIVALYGPTLPVRSTPWRDPQWITESVDSGPLECRPCDQRVCAPGDFRCLTHLAPERVLAAAEKALSGARAAAPNTSSERRHACQ
jgi:ADP-heptose:LPS heptosyltransferase